MFVFVARQATVAILEEEKKSKGKKRKPVKVRKAKLTPRRTKSPKGKPFDRLMGALREAVEMASSSRTRKGALVSEDQIRDAIEGSEVKKMELSEKQLMGYAKLGAEARTGKIRIDKKTLETSLSLAANFEKAAEGKQKLQWWS